MCVCSQHSFALTPHLIFSAWWCRSLLSSTSFTVVGIVNKVLTVLLNIMLWDKHASAWGTCSLIMCLVGGAMYRQAPLEAGKSVTTMDNSTTATTVVKEDIDPARAKQDREEVEMLLQSFVGTDEGKRKHTVM